MPITALPLAPPRSLLWRVPLLAAAYVGLARVGFLLDIEPGFASSIWPAAGVGTAALLVWGLRLVAGRAARLVLLQLVAVEAARRPASPITGSMRALVGRRRSAAASRSRR